MSNRKNIMLAAPLSLSKLKKWPLPYIVQPKLDGDRCRAIFSSEGQVTLLSSEENIIQSAPHIVMQLESLNLRDIELDGELFSPDMNHQAIRSIVGRTVNLHSDFESMEYHLFDIVTGDSQVKRCQLLRDVVRETDNIRIVETEIADDASDVERWLDKYMERGLEGIIVRHPFYSYLRTGRRGMMKFKPRKEDFYTIVGYTEEIDIYGTPKNSLGALILKSDTVDEQFKVGTGSYLTRERRIELWKIKETLPGQVAHIKYQALTDRKIPYHSVLVDIINPMFKF